MHLRTFRVEFYLSATNSTLAYANNTRFEYNIISGNCFVDFNESKIKFVESFPGFQRNRTFRVKTEAGIKRYKAREKIAITENLPRAPNTRIFNLCTQFF